MSKLRIVYKPRRGAAFVAPTLRPGEVIEVDAAEADAKLATGVFELAPKGDKVAASVERVAPAKDKGGR